MICCGAIPCGWALLSGPAPSSQLVCAARGRASPRSRTAPLFRRSVERFILTCTFLANRARSRPAKRRSVLASSRKNIYTCVQPSVHSPGGRMRRFALAFIVFIAATVGQSFAQPALQASGRRPFTFEDMMVLKRIGGPPSFPDSKRGPFSARGGALKTQKRNSHPRGVPLAGGEAQRLTFGPPPHAG